MTRVAVCELGPVAVRRLDPEPMVVDPVLAAAALQAGDDPMTVVGDRAVRTAAVWRQILATLLGDATEAWLIHPSWWPVTRPAMVAELAAAVVGEVTTRPRADGIEPGSMLVEIAPQLVLVAGGEGGLRAESRAGPPDELAARVTETALAEGPRRVALDAPADVPGAAALGDLITARLRAAGATVSRVDPRRWADSDEPVVPAARRARPRLRWAAALGLGTVLAGTAWLTVSGAGPEAAPTVALVEGRISADIPDGWSVRRVTGGPGSARLEVAAPGEYGAVLHITQAVVPDGDLSSVAATLRAALREQPPGVFVDFNPTDRRAARPAITYREVRPGGDIEWTVLVDDGIRVGVGCQGPPEAARQLRIACDAAIGSARRIR
ncbi:type VII secretion-associated protein [[Mycobacterium] wendilense]|uniref:Type VII secretion-associated protein n=1 Tax=[Mycobacterium] wendilense TaxID=3064284 RepID=A0ABM9MH60_9MYCO|nr:type VII secretion-associated protein [Mycolicibacterium sp. MU0050]CAJ1585158.1 type VII secretion-associated protein [Mycolicibacterium sp. MU0050]